MHEYFIQPPDDQPDYGRPAPLLHPGQTDGANPPHESAATDYENNSDLTGYPPTAATAPLRTDLIGAEHLSGGAEWEAPLLEHGQALDVSADTG